MSPIKKAWSWLQIRESSPLPCVEGPPETSQRAPLAGMGGFQGGGARWGLGPAYCWGGDLLFPSPEALSPSCWVSLEQIREVSGEMRQFTPKLVFHQHLEFLVSAYGSLNVLQRHHFMRLLKSATRGLPGFA